MRFSYLATIMGELLAAHSILCETKADLLGAKIV